MKGMIGLFAIAMVTIAACGGDDPEAAPGTFGATCSADPDCDSPLVCFEFGMGDKLCTKACTSSGDCSPESDQCNGMGFCKAN